MIARWQLHCGSRAGAFDVAWKTGCSSRRGFDTFESIRFRQANQAI
jgi:hypothetical protein